MRKPPLATVRGAAAATSLRGGAAGGGLGRGAIPSGARPAPGLGAADLPRARAALGLLAASVLGFAAAHVGHLGHLGHLGHGGAEALPDDAAAPLKRPEAEPLPGEAVAPLELAAFGASAQFPGAAPASRVAREVHRTAPRRPPVTAPVRR